MLRYYLTVAVLSCMALGAPQHRFAMPSQFSFRTVHIPTSHAIPKPTRLTGPLTTPQQEVASHIPVMVAVPNDFAGDSVVVTSDDLIRMGLSSAQPIEIMPETAQVDEVIVEEIQPEIAPVEEVIVEEIQPEIAPVEEVIVEEIQPEIDPVEEVVEEIQPETYPIEEVIVEEIQPEVTPVEEVILEEIQPEVAPDVEIVEEIIPEIVEPTVSLSQADEAFVLTAAAPEPEVIEVMEIIEAADPMPVDNTPIEVIPVETVQEAIQPVVSTTINPLDTETFRAYNNFLNTWLQLASVNLNRPDLLNLLNVPAPVVPQVAPVEITPEVIAEVIREEIIPEVVHEPVVAEIQPEQVEVIEPITEVAPEVFVDEIVTEVIPEEVPATEVLPQPEPVTEAAPVIKQDTVVFDTQVLPELTPAIIDTNTIAKSITSAAVPNILLRQVPRISSRGRFSGYTYSFSHVPQRGTYFLHPFTG